MFRNFLEKYFSRILKGAFPFKQEQTDGDGDGEPEAKMAKLESKIGKSRSVTRPVDYVNTIPTLAELKTSFS